MEGFYYFSEPPMWQPDKIVKKLMLFAIIVSSAAFSFGQEPEDTSILNIPKPVLGPNDTIPVPATVFQREWLPSQTLEWIWVSAPYPKNLLKKRREWTRLRNAVYVTYPYAVKAGCILNEIKAKLSGIDNREQRKKYLKTREKELKKEFTDPLTELSVYQGKVLMKLINRQTGNDCYDIIKEYQGGFSARLWQTVAFFFNSNLKQPYNPNGDEHDIEIIVLEVERMYRM